MHCRFFWGHNNRCANGTCCKSSKKNEQQLPTECVGCPYYQGNASSGSAGAKPVRNPEREKPKWEDTITNRMLHWSYTPEQKEEEKKALAAGVPKATILTYFYPEVTVERMSSYRNKH